MSLNSHAVDTALSSKTFIPFFQPLHEAHTGNCVGAEILARLRLADGRLSLPGEFLSRMNRACGLKMLTLIMMEQAGDWLADTDLTDGFILTVNITADMAGETWLSHACQRLTARARGRITLVLELTEQTPLTRPVPQWQQQLTGLKNAGVRLALDDFGVGNSGLHLLIQSGAGIIKLPREFVGQLGKCVVSGVITESIINLAGQLKLDLIAEGVETDQQREQLASLGVRLLQGWYFSPPLGGKEFSDYLRRYQ